MEDKIRKIKFLCDRMAWVVTSRPGKIPRDYYIFEVDDPGEAEDLFFHFSGWSRLTVVDIIPAGDKVYLRLIRPQHKYGAIVFLPVDKLIETLKKVVAEIGGEV